MAIVLLEWESCYCLKMYPSQKEGKNCFSIIHEAVCVGVWLLWRWLDKAFGTCSLGIRSLLSTQENEKWKSVCCIFFWNLKLSLMQLLLQLTFVLITLFINFVAYCRWLSQCTCDHVCLQLNNLCSSYEIISHCCCFVVVVKMKIIWSFDTEQGLRIKVKVEYK